MSKQVALYARASDRKQVQGELSIPGQLDAMRKYARDHDWTIYGEYADGGLTGTTTTGRNALEAMLSLAKATNRAFDAILVWKFSRFARNREDSVLEKAKLRRCGVTVISISEPVDDSASGKLLEGMIEVIDEFYSLSLAGDTLRGMKMNASKGFYNGGATPTGYKAKTVMDGIVQRTLLEPDETYAPIVKRMFRLCSEGLGAKEIAKALNADGPKTPRKKPWSKGTILNILRNVVYVGTMAWNRQSDSTSVGSEDAATQPFIKENAHEALVESDLFETVQKLLRARGARQQHPREVTSDYLLSGRVYCGKCGHKMTGSAAKSGRYRYYACSEYAKRGKTICSGKMVRKDRLEDQVVDQIGRQILTAVNIKRLVAMVNNEANLSSTGALDELSALRGQLRNRQHRLDSLYNALETGKLDLDDLAPRIKEGRADMEALEVRIADLDRRAHAGQIEIKDSVVAAMVEDMRALLHKGLPHERRDFIRSLVKRVNIVDREASIDYLMPIGPACKPRRSKVLPIDKNGSPAWTRTRNPLVNSQVLCQLSYRGAS